MADGDLMGALRRMADYLSTAQPHPNEYGRDVFLEDMGLIHAAASEGLRAGIGAGDMTLTDEIIRDAARYRYLRDLCPDVDLRAALSWMGQDIGIDAAIDAAIDRAIAAKELAQPPGSSAPGTSSET